MSEIVVDSDGDGVERWLLNNAPRRNALSKALVGELGHHLARIAAEPRTVRAVVLTGAGDKAFCAGADLKERSTMSEEDVQLFLKTLGRTLRAVEQSHAVFIAFLNGLALGGGAEVALACDFRIMSPQAQLGFPEVSLGIIPGAGGTQRLPRLIGRGAAKDLILTARRVDAAEAVALGVANQQGSLEDAMALARRICANAPKAVAAAKHAIDEGAHLALDEALEVEYRHYLSTLHTQDRLEGLRAFAEKRPPRFVGR